MTSKSKSHEQGLTTKKCRATHANCLTPVPGKLKLLL